MAELTCQFVRPDRLLYEGPVSSLILVSHSGELGVWPGHAAEICSLGDGIVRLHQTPENGGGEKHVIISGGYAEINPEGVIILADHARDVDDIEHIDTLGFRGEAIPSIAAVSRFTLARTTTTRSSGVISCSSRQRRPEAPRRRRK